MKSNCNYVINLNMCEEACHSLGHDSGCHPGAGQSDLEKRLERLEKELEEALSLAKKNRPYKLCEFYSFRNPQKGEGFELAYGELLENVAALYPEAWAFLQTDEGKALCVTEEEWQAMTHAVYYTATSTDETGAEVKQEFSFDGIGGAPFYVQDLDAGTLRLPDVRGMYAEASGFDGLGVGGVHGDMGRVILGELNSMYSTTHGIVDINAIGITGAFYKNKNKHTARSAGFSGDSYGVSFDSSHVTPTGNANKPRAFGVLPCVYLGNSK